LIVVGAPTLFSLELQLARASRCLGPHRRNPRQANAKNDRRERRRMQHAPDPMRVRRRSASGHGQDEHTARIARACAGTAGGLIVTIGAVDGARAMKPTRLGEVGRPARKLPALAVPEKHMLSAQASAG
jgi:hypothetical protein